MKLTDFAQTFGRQPEQIVVRIFLGISLFDLQRKRTPGPPEASHTSRDSIWGVVWEWGSHYWRSLEFPLNLESATFARWKKFWVLRLANFVAAQVNKYSEKAEKRKDYIYAAALIWDYNREALLKWWAILGFWISQSHIWVFPKIGVPPNHPFVDRVFHYFHHPFWGKHPYFWKHPSLFPQFLWWPPRRCYRIRLCYDRL